MSYSYAPIKNKLLARLDRAEGQVRGLAGMIENDRYCIDIITQIGAVQAALDKVALELLREHTKYCLSGKRLKPGELESKTEELITTIGRLIGK